MSENKVRLTIAGSLVWIALAATTILSTHGGALAQPSGDEYQLPSVDQIIAPASESAGTHC